MNFIQEIPAVAKVFGVFIIILICIRKKLSLGHAFLFGSAILGLIFFMPIESIVKSALLAVVDLKTLSLSLIVSLILVLSNSMDTTGQMKRLLENFQGLVPSPEINLIIFPALIGLLPMPGGAIFSAPMVKTIGAKTGLTSAHLSYANYWFRHIWEYFWPLYPGVLLCISLADIDILSFILLLLPLTIISMATGYWQLKRVMPRANKSKPNKSQKVSPIMKPPIYPIIKELAPILIVIVFGLCAGAILSAVLKPGYVNIAKELGLIGSLVISIWWVWRTNKVSFSQRWSILRQRQMLEIIYMVTTILIFKGILEDSKAVESVSKEFIQWRIPLMPITVILPMIVGIISGITIAFVGTTFPILISLIYTFGQTHLMLPYIMLAMVSGFIGVLFSPLHLCLLLSNKYFNTTIESVYRLMLIPCVAILASSWIYFLILYHVLPLGR